MTDEQLDTCLWAKMGDTYNPYPQIAHLLDTAASAMVLWDQWLNANLRDLIASALGVNDRTARTLVAYAAATHDIGKINPVFQLRLGTRKDRQPAWVPQAVEALGAYPNTDLARDWYGDTPHKIACEHEVISFQYLNSGRHSIYNLAPDSWVAGAALGHHGQFFNTTGDVMLSDDIEHATTGRWAEQARAHLTAIRAALDITDIPRLTGPAAGSVFLLISGFVVLADHLASEDGAEHTGRAHTSVVNPASDGRAWVNARRDWFAERLPHTLGVYKNPPKPDDTIIPKDEHGKPCELTPLQRDAGRIGRGLWLVMAPTGDAKTVASALRHLVEGDEGLLFALPTMATADVMMPKITGWYRDVNTIGGLVHSTASLHDFYNPPKVKDGAVPEGGPDAISKIKPGHWYKRNRQLRALLAPVVVSTCDQVLRGALTQSWAHLRLLALANKHVILDEVHTYDQYQTQLLCELLAWWGATRTRVTLLSATLPTWQQNAFMSAYNVNAPQITPGKARFPEHLLLDPVTGTLTAPDVPFETRRAPYEQHLTYQVAVDSVTAHVAWAKGMRAKHPRARLGVVVNTVDAAITVAARLTEEGHNVVLLHSRMTAAHRRAATKRLVHDLGPLSTTRPDQGHGEGVTVVGTQVIEASLDIDLDAMSTDLAPVASMIQRAGRTWRFEDKERRRERIGDLADATGPTLHVVAVHEGPGLAPRRQLPYLFAEQSRAAAATRNRPVVRVPADVQEYVDEAAFSLEDAVAAVQASTGDDGAEAELRDLMLRDGAAARAKANLRPSATDPGLLGECTYYRLIALTADNVTRDEGATRYIDRHTASFVLVDPTGEHPYALPLAAEALAAVGREQNDTLKSALGATVAVSGALVETMKTASATTLRGREWKPAAFVLGDTPPVDVRVLERLVYDDLGLHPRLR